jgi:hypothetical protein
MNETIRSAINAMDDTLPSRFWTSNSWDGADLVRFGQTYRLTADDGEVTLYVLNEHGVMRYRVEFTDAPVAVIIAAVEAAMSH